MRRASSYAASLLAVAALAACDNTTGQNGCNLPVETASVTTSTGSADGVVRRIDVGGVGYTPGGYDPWTQVDVFVSFPVHTPAGHATLDIIVGKGVPVLIQRANGVSGPASACSIRVGDKVTVWAPLQILSDQPNGNTATFANAAFEAQKVVIDRGN